MNAYGHCNQIPHQICTCEQSLAGSDTTRTCHSYASRTVAGVVTLSVLLHHQIVSLRWTYV